MSTTTRDASFALNPVSPGTVPLGRKSQITNRKWWSLALRLKDLFGVDRAIAYTVLARVVQILASTGTVLLILRFLTPIEQGYYYTLLSLVSLQIVFELGFSFVILQMAAHESVHLTIHNDGRITGDALVHARLASVLQLTVRWYLRAAVAMALILIPLGIVFFSRKSPSGVSISWLGPWVTAVLAVSVSFLLTPLYSFFEGCKQIWQVARVRMYQALMVMVMSWGAIASHHGLYACALVNLGVVLVGLWFLARRRALLAALLRFPVRGDAISWDKEIWPFQWRIAVSWLCSYFMLQIFTPVLFACQGPSEAGRLGLSLSIVGYLPVLVLSWMSTKATAFGQLVKLRRFRQLDLVFFRTLRQSLMLILLLAAGCFAAVIAVKHVSLKIAARMESPAIFVLLLMAAVCIVVVQSLGIYLRSFKQEPYLLQSVAVAGLTFFGILLVVPRCGSSGVAMVYFLCSGLLAALWAVLIFKRWRSARALDCSQAGEMASSIQLAN